MLSALAVACAAAPAPAVWKLAATADCPLGCGSDGRGLCVNGLCICSRAWRGPTCSESTCPSAGVGGLPCSGHGACAFGACTCVPGWLGPACNVPDRLCANDCSGRGHGCVNGTCICNAGWRGADCTEPVCESGCSGHGRCVEGACSCDDGWAGPACALSLCADNCSGHGSCVAPGRTHSRLEPTHARLRPRTRSFDTPAPPLVCLCQVAHAAAAGVASAASSRHALAECGAAARGGAATATAGAMREAIVSATPAPGRRARMDLRGRRRCTLRAADERGLSYREAKRPHSALSTLYSMKALL